MGFNVTTQSPKLVQAVGSYTEICTGMTTMACGTGTVTATQLSRLDGIVGCVQGSSGVGEIVICTATSGNTATLETVDECGCTSGSSVVMWMAWGLAKR